MAALSKGETCDIYGDGLTSRDFCFVANAVQANLRAALVEGAVTDTIYNVSVGDKTSLTQLFAHIRDRIAKVKPAVASLQARHLPERKGDIRDSQANTTLIREKLGYAPTHSGRAGA